MKLNNQEMIHWWQGYVVIQIKGKKLERLINRMMNQRFAAWQIVRTGEELAQLSITLRDFFQLRALLKETGCTCRIRQRRGLPFFLKRVQRRMGLYSGIILFIFLLYAFSMMIWSVEVDGVEIPETEMEIRQELARMNVKPGSFKFQAPDYQTIQRQIMQLVPNTTWVGFSYEGTRAHIKVVEKTLPDLKKTGGPRHLIAKKKAIVHELFVEEGQAVVKPNQYVKTGDILVSGIIGTDANPKIVSATGTILGEVWYEGNLEVPLLQKQSALTGAGEKRYYVKLGSFPLKLWGYGELPFDKYVTTVQEYTVDLRNWKLPISWLVEDVKETYYAEQRISEQEATEQALVLAREQMQKKLPPDAVIKEENILRKRVENGKVYIKMHYTVIEEIASELPLGTSN